MGKVEPATGKTGYEDLQKCSNCCGFCQVATLCCCMNCMSSSGAKDPDVGKWQIMDMRHCAEHSIYGIIFNNCYDHAYIDWGFDPKETKKYVSGANKVMVSYAEDDNDAVPAMGAWLGQFFEATVNADRGEKHDTFGVRQVKTCELLEQFYGLTMGKSAPAQQTM